LFPVVNILRRVVTQVVLLAIVAFNFSFQDTDISQDSVATNLVCSGIFSDSVIINVLQIQIVK